MRTAVPREVFWLSIETGKPVSLERLALEAKTTIRRSAFLTLEDVQEPKEGARTQVPTPRPNSRQK